MRRIISRRQFLGYGLTLGAGLSLGAPLLARMQDATESPETTPEGTPTTSLELTGNISPVHDPSIIKEGDTYYVFCTGTTIPIRTSTDLLHWNMAFPPLVFIEIPQWAQDIIPGQHDIWAPDISYYNDKFHLYYAVSTFGENTSVIGLATNKTLDRASDDYEWVDEGLVLQSTKSNDYNCIDPNLIVDADGVPWLAFGSFWTGIKMRRLDFATGKPSSDDETLYSLAQRPSPPDAVEAPFIIRKGDFYYLFVSFDFCCRGAESTYHVMVGRSENVTGPYVDRDGLEMLKGGGTQVTFPTDRWRGPGHNAILQDNGIEYIVYHSYDAETAGAPTLRIDPLTWDEDGWPSISTPA
jgi:arabinan endo-1,5-alpha-L-arabinosidase